MIEVYKCETCHIFEQEEHTCTNDNEKLSIIEIYTIS